MISGSQMFEQCVTQAHSRDQLRLYTCKLQGRVGNLGDTAVDRQTIYAAACVMARGW